MKLVGSSGIKQDDSPIVLLEALCMKLYPTEARPKIDQVMTGQNSSLIFTKRIRQVIEIRSLSLGCIDVSKHAFQN